MATEPTQPRRRRPAAPDSGSVPQPDPTILTTEALEREIDTLDKLLSSRVEIVQAAVDANRRQMDERARAQWRQVRAMDRRLEERYVTQSKALDAAFVAADKAVQAALDSAERAVAKAEVAADKRYEAITAIVDRINSLMAHLQPRSEADVAHRAFEDKLSDSIARATERFADLNRRLDLIDGRTAGASGRDQKVMAIIGAIAAGFSILLAIGALIAVVIR